MTQRVDSRTATHLSTTLSRPRPRGSSVGARPVLLNPCTHVQFSATFLNTYVPTNMSSFGVPMYVNFALCTTVAYAMSVPMSRYFTSINFPADRVMSSLSIISRIISPVIGLPLGQDEHHPGWELQTAIAVGAKAFDTRPNRSFIVGHGVDCESSARSTRAFGFRDNAGSDPGNSGKTGGEGESHMGRRALRCDV